MPKWAWIAFVSALVNSFGCTDAMNSLAHSESALGGNLGIIDPAYGYAHPTGEILRWYDATDPNSPDFDDENGSNIVQLVKGWVTIGTGTLVCLEPHGCEDGASQVLTAGHVLKHDFDYMFALDVPVYETLPTQPWRITIPAVDKSIINPSLGRNDLGILQLSQRIPLDLVPDGFAQIAEQYPEPQSRAMFVGYGHKECTEEDMGGAGRKRARTFQWPHSIRRLGSYKIPRDTLGNCNGDSGAPAYSSPSDGSAVHSIAYVHSGRSEDRTQAIGADPITKRGALMEAAAMLRAKHGEDLPFSTPGSAACMQLESRGLDCEVWSRGYCRWDAEQHCVPTDSANQP